MDTAKLIVPGVFAILLGGACDPSLDPSSIATTQEMTETARLATEVGDIASSYGRAFSSTVDDYVECERLLGVYESRVRPSVDELVGAAPRMDRYMRMHGGDDEADAECAATMMAAELDHHHTYVCVTVGAVNRNAEARRHVVAMNRYSGRLFHRSNEIMMGLDLQNWIWDPVMSDCEGWDEGDVCLPMMGDECNGPIVGR